MAAKRPRRVTRPVGKRRAKERVSSAAKKRASIWKMAHQSGHKSLDVLRRYVENEEVFDDHAGADLLK